jgi:hypothetical protein
MLNKKKNRLQELHRLHRLLQRHQQGEHQHNEIR